MQYTGNRLVGRSAWNDRWKIVIPGNTLLNDPEEGLDRLIKVLDDCVNLGDCSQPGRNEFVPWLPPRCA